ncbi:LuxR C-terminal-related transcriptional regulator, partial [Pseudomonas aeruginosa]|uniref:LuxR C-terminal-related transcriptional regulator n=2 Tax=Pseudomonas aeruginosa TaxID=287 RepID=UPI0021F0B3B5
VLFMVSPVLSDSVAHEPVTQNFGHPQIGLILSIDQRTVKFHIVNAMRKLNSSNKAEATMKAYAIGLLN